MEPPPNAQNRSSEDGGSVNNQRKSSVSPKRLSRHKSFSPNRRRTYSNDRQRDVSPSPRQRTDKFSSTRHSVSPLGRRDNNNGTPTPSGGGSRRKLSKTPLLTGTPTRDESSNASQKPNRKKRSITRTKLKHD